MSLTTNSAITTMFCLDHGSVFPASHFLNRAIGECRKMDVSHTFSAPDVIFEDDGFEIVDISRDGEPEMIQIVADGRFVTEFKRNAVGEMIVALTKVLAR